MGSSLRVTPAADFPEEVYNHGGKLVIINLQKTGLDNKCTLKINALVDDVMQLLMKELNTEIPHYKIQRGI
jgi:NAD-dependent SIR2 family protein deacetylase